MCRPLRTQFDNNNTRLTVKVKSEHYDKDKSPQLLTDLFHCSPRVTDLVVKGGRVSTTSLLSVLQSNFACGHLVALDLSITYSERDDVGFSLDDALTLFKSLRGLKNLKSLNLRKKERLHRLGLRELRKHMTPLGPKP